MKLHTDHLEGVNVISSYAPGTIVINGQPWQRSSVIPWRGPVTAWSCPDVAALRSEHFDVLLPFEPELVVFGSGPTLQFPPLTALRALISRRIGVESMDTAAACRTYTILAAEGRRVIAALRLA